MLSEEQHRQEIVEAGRKLYDLGFVAATDGNISVRLDSRRILVTPSGVSKGAMDPESLLVVDIVGRQLSGQGKPSSEIGMHLLIYSRRQDIHAVVHAHPPVATGYAAAGVPLDKALLPEVVISLGCIPLAGYATPGTAEMSASLSELVPSHDAILMANHGAVAYGQDLKHAFWKMETVEHSAKICLVTEMLGRQNVLRESEVSKLFASRPRYLGPGAPTEWIAGCPLASEQSPRDPRCREIGTAPPASQVPESPDPACERPEQSLTANNVERIIREVLSNLRGQ